MPLLVVGSIALDTVQTPHGRVENVLGGSAVYFSYAANFFNHVRLVGVVGKDFPQEYKQILASKNVDISGLEVVEGKTFRWSGCYEGAMNAAQTLLTELNVFATFEPKIPHLFRDSKFIFLANGGPATQKSVLKQIHAPKLIVADTMNLWINEQRDELLDLMRQVDGLVLNEEEARLLTREMNLIKAGKQILKVGLKFVVIKKGEHGAMLVSPEGFFICPAYPTEHVKDPTGAGDSFAGGMMGYLAKTRDISHWNLKRALIYGTIVASFNVEDFSLNRFHQITLDDIEKRYKEFISMVSF
ncbi:MAG TPA: PfkB family carbohydrate kinase [Candidatus Brocadiia bacterium]|nr:sugar kinase [Planctomycetota bacterium]